MIGRSSPMPSQFDRKRLGAFASDGFMYETEVIELCRVLKNNGVIAWATWPTQLVFWRRFRTCGSSPANKLAPVAGCSRDLKSAELHD